MEQPILFRSRSGEIACAAHRRAPETEWIPHEWRAVEANELHPKSECWTCAGSAQPSTRTISVLNVDDRAEAVYVRDRILRAQGFAVTNSQSGRIGVQLAHELRPDVVLLDVMLKDGDGRDLCRRLKANPATAHIPVVLISAILTGQGSEGDSVTASGADAFVKEPVEPDVLVSVVRRLVGDPASHQQ
jgi:CheY-like chemotaxis protein